MVYCHHPFAKLVAVGVPGQTWCKACKEVVMCNHPFFRHNWQEEREISCEACGSVLPQDRQLVMKIMHVALPRNNIVH